MDEHVEATILVGIYLGGTLRTYLANQVKTGSPSFARMARRNSPQPSLPEKLTMCAANTANNNLQWDVLTIKRPGLTRDLPAGKEELMWVANSSTLIYGERHAVLADTFLTTKQSQALVDWVVATGKNLTRSMSPTDMAIIFSALHHCWSVSRMPGQSRYPRSSRPCMSIYRPPGSRTSGAGFSQGKSRTACWLPNRSKTTFADRDGCERQREVISELVD